VLSSLLWFLLVLCIVVFVHELGHYLIARWNGAKVEVFSIGFGRELFGVTDRAGTRWRLSVIPLGGYVRFPNPPEREEGDAGVPEVPDESLQAHAPVRRIAILAAGPAANFLFAVIVFFGLILTFGRAGVSNTVEQVLPDSAAESAGILAGDRILSIEGQTVTRAQEIRDAVSPYPGTVLTFVIDRDGRVMELDVTPVAVDWTDPLGTVHRLGRVGVALARPEREPATMPEAAWDAVGETWYLTSSVLQAFGEILTGRRSTDELGGPVMIAQVSGDFAEQGLLPLFGFIAFLSVNLGIINLFPIPMLDGGQIVVAVAELARGRRLSQRFMYWFQMTGLVTVGGLMLFVLANDLSRPSVLNFVGGLFQ